MIFRKRLSGRIIAPGLVVAAFLCVGMTADSTQSSPHFAVWGHGFAPPELSAASSTLAEEADVLADLGMMVNVDADELLSSQPSGKMATLRESGVRMVVRLYSTSLARKAIDAGAEVGNATGARNGEMAEPLFAHPKFIETMAEQAGATAKRISHDPVLKSLVYGFWLIDEPFARISRVTLDPKERCEYLNQVARTFRTEFGRGRFEFPTRWIASSRDPRHAPQRIAYLSWWDSRLLELQKRVYEAVKGYLPEARVLTGDLYFSGGIEPHDYSALGSYADEILCVAYSWIEGRQRGRGTHNPGFATKLLSDLTGKPVWTHPQIIQYRGRFARGNPSPREALGRFAQVFRAGGKGVFLYAYEAFQTERPRYLRHADPAMWAVIEKAAEASARIDSLQLGVREPDCAIYIPYESMLAGSGGDALYSAYVMLGPQLKQQFTFITDTHLQGAGFPLNRMKAVYVADGTYAQEESIQRLAAYVHHGGTLLLMDPTSFSYDPEGGPLQARQALTGVGRFIVERRPPSELVTRVEGEDRLPLPVGSSKCYSLHGLSGTARAIGWLGRGRPGIVENTVGAGRVIVFGCNPFALDTLENPEWKRFLAFLGARLGLGREACWEQALPFETVAP